MSVFYSWKIHRYYRELRTIDHILNIENGICEDKRFFDKETIESIYKDGKVVHRNLDNDKILFAYIAKQNLKLYYDENSNLIYADKKGGYKEWNIYDKNNNIIYHKNTDGIEELYFHADSHYSFYELRNCGSRNGRQHFFLFDQERRLCTECSKEEWVDSHTKNNFDFKLIFDILETLSENNESQSLTNVKKHINGLHVLNLEEKYKNILPYWSIYKNHYFDFLLKNFPSPEIPPHKIY